VRRLITLLFLAPLRLYKAFVSPLLPPSCRFHPSCSVYAMGAIAVHGPLKGVALAVRRVARCHPFHPGGLDPVPPRNGDPAEVVLAHSEPALAQRLMEPPPPHLAAVLTPPPNLKN
jgi:uncharacterized protein